MIEPWDVDREVLVCSTIGEYSGILAFLEDAMTKKLLESGQDQELLPAPEPSDPADNSGVTKFPEDSEATTLLMSGSEQDPQSHSEQSVSGPDDVLPPEEQPTDQDRIKELQDQVDALLEEKQRTDTFFRWMLQSLRGLWWWLVGSDIEETSDELLGGLKDWESREKDEEGEPKRFPASKTVLFALSVIRRSRQFTVAWIFIIGLPGLLGCLLTTAGTGLSLWSNLQTRDLFEFQAAESSSARRAQVIGTLYDTEPGCVLKTCPEIKPSENNDRSPPASCSPEVCLLASLRAREEALKAYTEICKSEKRKIYLPRLNLTAGSLEGVYLTEAELQGARLPKSDLTRAYLQGAKFSEADLTGALFWKAILTEAVFFKANLTDARFWKAYLVKANLKMANLTRADFSDAYLTRAILQSANLRRADLQNADARWTHCYDTNFTEADLRGANLEGAYLVDADFTRARYDVETTWPKGFEYKTIGAIGPGTDLKGADLKGADLKGADLDRADLKGADLKGADLKGADLTKAMLVDADFTRARYDVETTWPKGFEYKTIGAIGPGTDLKGADLKGADLKGADLDRADLKGANLEGANLEGARLGGANLKGARLKGTNLTNTYPHGADLQGAKYNNETMWPVGFSPQESGAILSE